MAKKSGQEFKVGHIAGKPLQFFMQVQQGVWNVASFFAFLPLLDQQTSGRERNAFERVYEPCFEAFQSGFSALQMGQAKLYHKLGLLEPRFCSKVYKEHAHNLERSVSDPAKKDSGRFYSMEARVKDVVSNYKSGFFDLKHAIQEMSETCHYITFPVEYDPQSKGFYVFPTVTDKEHEDHERARDLMQDFILEVKEDFEALPKADQQELAFFVNDILESMPLTASETSVVSENSGFFVSPRDSEGRIYTVFNRVAGNGSESFVYSRETGVLPVKEAVEEIEGRVQFMAGRFGSVSGVRPSSKAHPSQKSVELEHLERQRDYLKKFVR